MNSQSTRASRALAALALALTAGACGSDVLTNPTPVTPTSATETYNGTLSRNGAATYSFAVTTVGQTTNVTAQLSNVEPDNTIAIGIALGTWNGAACQIVISNDKALMGATIYGTVNTSGTLCVRVFDVGNVNDPVNYEVKVVHF